MVGVARYSEPVLLYKKHANYIRQSVVTWPVEYPPLGYGFWHPKKITCDTLEQCSSKCCPPRQYGKWAVQATVRFFTLSLSIQIFSINDHFTKRAPSIISSESPDVSRMTRLNEMLSR